MTSDLRPMPSAISEVTGLRYQLNDYESRFLYEEIFAQETYGPIAGYLDAKSPLVIDIGANIGMFTAMVRKVAPAARVRCFEPVPDIHRVLRHNFSQDANVLTTAAAVGPHASVSTFRYYPLASFLSSEADRPARTPEDLLKVMYGELSNDSSTIDPAARDMMLRQARARTIGLEVTAPCMSINDVLDDATDIDVLKIDIEGAELDVLQAIASTNWQKIHYLAIEKQMSPDMLGQVRDLAQRYSVPTNL